MGDDRGGGGHERGEERSGSGLFVHTRGWFIPGLHGHRGGGRALDLQPGAALGIDAHHRDLCGEVLVPLEARGVTDSLLAGVGELQVLGLMGGGGTSVGAGWLQTAGWANSFALGATDEGNGGGAQGNGREMGGKVSEECSIGWGRWAHRRWRLSAAGPPS